MPPLALSLRSSPTTPAFCATPPRAGGDFHLLLPSRPLRPLRPAVIPSFAPSASFATRRTSTTPAATLCAPSSDRRGDLNFG
jgi:hypothetical protein